jgi:hypothetical protein
MNRRRIGADVRFDVTPRRPNATAGDLNTVASDGARRRVVRLVAETCRDARECRTFIEMLGLTLADVRNATRPQSG